MTRVRFSVPDAVGIPIGIFPSSRGEVIPTMRWTTINIKT